MKLFSYLLVACAGLGLFACNTENDPVIENGDGVTKSVSLKLNGISGSLNTKAVEPGTAVAGKIVLKDLKIVFYDKTAANGPIYRIEEFDGTSTNPTDVANWTALTGTADIFFTIWIQRLMQYRLLEIGKMKENHLPGPT